MHEYRDEQIQTDYLKDISDLTDVIVPTIKRNSALEFEIFLAMIPKWKFDIGDYYERLTKNMYKWDEFFELCKYKLLSFEDYIHNDYFYEIINIHNQLVKAGYKDGILPMLNVLIHRKTHFLIPYVYITNQMPKEFKKINYLFFGLTDKYPDMINRAKNSIKKINLPVLPVKEIFKIHNIDVDPTYDLI